MKEMTYCALFFGFFSNEKIICIMQQSLLTMLITTIVKMLCLLLCFGGWNNSVTLSMKKMTYFQILWPWPLFSSEWKVLCIIHRCFLTIVYGLFCENCTKFEYGIKEIMIYVDLLWPWFFGGKRKIHYSVFFCYVNYNISTNIQCFLYLEHTIIKLRSLLIKITFFDLL